MAAAVVPGASAAQAEVAWERVIEKATAEQARRAAGGGVAYPAASPADTDVLERWHVASKRCVGARGSLRRR